MAQKKECGVWDFSLSPQGREGSRENWHRLFISLPLLMCAKIRVGWEEEEKRGKEEEGVGCYC